MMDCLDWVTELAGLDGLEGWTDSLDWLNG